MQGADAQKLQDCNYEVVTKKTTLHESGKIKNHNGIAYTALIMLGLGIKEQVCIVM